MKSKLKLAGSFLLTTAVMSAGSLQGISSALKTEAGSIVVDIATIVFIGVGIWGACTSRYGILIGAGAGVLIALKADTIVQALQAM